MAIPSHNLLPDVLAAKVFGPSVLAVLEEAWTSQPSGSLIKGSTYNNVDGLHAIEIMDEKLDPGAVPDRFPDVYGLILEGTLKLTTLTQDEVLSICENILQLEISWLHGNSFPQTLATNLYLHPVCIQTMRKMLGLNLHKHILDTQMPGLSNTMHKFRREQVEIHDDPLSYLGTDLLAAEVVPLERGTPEYTTVSFLLAFVSLTLKTCEIHYRAIMRADLLEDEDFCAALYGIDLLFACDKFDVMQHALQVLHSLDSTASSKNELITAWDSCLNPSVHPWVASSDTAASTGKAEPTRHASLLHFRISYLVAASMLTPNAYPPVEPLQWGTRYPLGDVDIFLRTAYTALCRYGNCGPELAQNESLGCWPKYASTFFPSTSPRFVPLATRNESFLLFRRLIADVTLAAALPQIASYNPWRPISREGIHAAGTHHPCSVLSSEQVTELPASLAEIFAAYNVSTKAPLPASAARTSHGSAVAAAFPVDPIALPPPILFSGIEDPPMPWLCTSEPEIPAKIYVTPPTGEPTALNMAPGGAVSSGPYANKNVVVAAGARNHVSLHAILKFLNVFSKRQPSIVARSWLASILYESPLPESLPQEMDYETYPLSAERSAVVLGDHTMVEVIRQSFADTGVSAELMGSVEGRKLVLLLDRPMQNLFRHLLGSRLRIRRRMDPILRDWSVIVVESEQTDALYGTYLDFMAAEADDLWLCRKLGINTLPLDSEEIERHRHLHFLRASQPMSRLTFWALDIAVRLMLLNLEIGFECDLYHDDELAAVYWYMDHFLSVLLRQQQNIDAGITLSASFPELRKMTQASLNTWKSGGAWHLARGPPSLAAPIDFATIDNDAGVAVSSAKEDNNKQALAALRKESSSWVQPVLKVIDNCHPLSAFYTLERDELCAKSRLCKATIRVLACFGSAGLWRGLPYDDAAPILGDKCFVRISENAFKQRFRDFACFNLPKPLDYKDYVDAFRLSAPSAAGANNLLLDAAVQLSQGVQYCRRAMGTLRDTKTPIYGSIADIVNKARTSKETAELRAKEKKRAAAEQQVARGTESPSALMALQDPAPISPFAALMASVSTAELLQMCRVSANMESFIKKQVMSAAIFRRFGPTTGSMSEESRTTIIPILAAPADRLQVERNMHSVFYTFKWK